MDVSIRLPRRMVFKGDIEGNWKKFKQCFQIYLEASGKIKKGDSYKIALLLNLLGNQGVDIYNIFSYGDTEDKNNYVTVLRKFDEYCNSRKNIIINRFNFFSRSQYIDESIDEYVTALKALAMLCEFGTEMDNLIRDRLVIGIIDKESQKKLLEQSKLDLNEALNMCKADEAIKKPERGINTESSTVRDRGNKCDKTENQTERRNNQRKNKKKKVCFRCGVKHTPNCTENLDISISSVNKEKENSRSIAIHPNNGNDNTNKNSRQSSAATEPKTCNQCKQVIQGGVLTALDQTWHPEHFWCNECKEPITEAKFRTNDGLPYCTPCYTKRFAPKCHACDEPILDKCVQAMGVNWHEDHFVCKDCKTKLIGTQFMDLGGVPHCQKCYIAKHADRCKGCSKPIADKAIVALDAKWHQMCFRCSKCSKPIMKDQSFQVDAGKPHCVKC